MSKKSKKEARGSAAAGRGRVLAAGAFACVLVAAGVVTSAARHESPAGAAPRAAAPAAGPYVPVEVEGRSLRVNAQTLQQGPLTQEQARQLAEALRDNQSTSGLVEVRHADGAVSMDLDDRFRNVMMARKNEDGSVTTGCVDTPEAAEEFLLGAAPAPAPTAEEGPETGRKAARE